MASAGLLKLLHSGIQDERLLPPENAPRIEFFEKAFVKGGRFTTEWYRVDFDNRPAFGSTAKVTLPRRGHLISRVLLVTQLPDLAAPQQQARNEAGNKFAGPSIGWTNSIGHALIQQAQLTIAAAPISTLDGRLLEVLDEFHTPLEKLTVVNRLLGRKDSNYQPQTNQQTQVVTPLPFWFSRGDPSAALPIDAIGTDIVQLSITFAPLQSLYTTTTRTKNAQGQLTMPPLGNNPFYMKATTLEGGLPVPGLNGNPDVSIRVKEIPGIQIPDPSALQIGTDTYLLCEYVYLDKAEANRIRLADISYPIVQHYAIPPYETKQSNFARIPLRIPNPTRDLYFFCHRTDADLLNAPFLATRDLSGLPVVDVSGVGVVAPWWPDAQGLNTVAPLPLVPAYTSYDSEPIRSLALMYEGKIVRYATDSPTFFRTILPSFEKRKTPWLNKYYYNLPFGTQHDYFGITQHAGEANLDKIPNLALELEFNPVRGTIFSGQVPSYTVYIWAETYNILRVFGGRAGLLFNY